MIEVALMIEGQNGINWENFQKIALLAEEVGFVGLYRSDHYTNANPPDKDSLELWVSLTWLASHTKQIEFGPMVSPLSFRDPTMTARMASAVDDLSNGRLTLGLGAGWQDREHHNFGWELLDTPERMNRFEEGLEIISLLMNNNSHSTFEGKYYQIREALMLPRPLRPSGPPILIGGNGPKRTLPLVAKYASEWNSIFLNIPDFKNLNQILNQELEKESRKPSDVKRSMMTGFEYGRDQKELDHRVEKRSGGQYTAAQLFDQDKLFGTPNQLVQKLGEWHETGLQRVMLQWLDLENIDLLESFAHHVFPQLNN